MPKIVCILDNFFAQRSLVSNCRGPRDRFEGILKGDFNSAAKTESPKILRTKMKSAGQCFCPDAKQRSICMKYLTELKQLQDSSVCHSYHALSACPICILITLHIFSLLKIAITVGWRFQKRGCHFIELASFFCLTVIRPSQSYWKGVGLKMK